PRCKPAAETAARVSSSRAVWVAARPEPTARSRRVAAGRRILPLRPRRALPPGAFTARYCGSLSPEGLSMSRLLIVLSLALLALFPLASRADPFEQMPQETVGKYAAAAADAAKSRPRVQSDPVFDLAIDRAIGYRLGDGSVVIVPDKALIGRHR